MARCVFIMGIVALFCGIRCGAEDGFRIFTDTQGRAVTAKVIKLDTRRGLVELELENRARKKVKPTVFCEADQAYLCDWQKVDEFMSAGFKVEIEKRTVEEWTEKGSVQRDYEKIAYEIRMRNSGTVGFEDVRVDYNIFYEQEELGYGSNALKKETVPGRKIVEMVLPQKNCVVMTDPVVIYSQHLSGGYDEYVSGAPTNQSGKMKGIWVKLYFTTPSGAEGVREICEPSNVKDHQKWEELPQPKIQQSEEDRSTQKKRKKKKRND